MQSPKRRFMASDGHASAISWRARKVARPSPSRLDDHHWFREMPSSRAMGAPCDASRQRQALSLRTLQPTAPINWNPRKPCALHHRSMRSACGLRVVVMVRGAAWNRGNPSPAAIPTSISVALLRRTVVVGILCKRSQFFIAAFHGQLRRRRAGSGRHRRLGARSINQSCRNPTVWSNLATTATQKKS